MREGESVSDDNCELCGGCGEIEAEYPDGQRDVVGCPFCMSKQLNACIADLNRINAQYIDTIASQAARIAELEAALLLICNNGGTTTDEGLSCNGSWCAEQARKVLRK